MIFTLIAIAMVLVAVACVAIPLWRRPDAVRDAKAGAFQVHNRNLKLLERRLKKGELDTADYLAARRELEENFQAQLSNDEPVAQQTSAEPLPRPRRGTAVLLGILIPALAAGLYLSIGNWRVATGDEQLAAQQSVNQMVESLAKRLNTTDPDDAKGWVMLGRSYVVMGRYTDAVSAYEHAHRLTGDSDPDLLADYAEAIILANPDDPAKLAADAAPLVSKALTAAPNDPKALWYSGVLALKANNKALAIQRWRKVLEQNPSPEIRQMVEQHIKDAGGKVTEPVAATSSGKFIIPVHVTVTAQLARKVPADATLFVFVRPTDSQAGPPLLAARLQVKSLPANIELSDANAMMPGTSLSGYKQVEVMARVSVSGSPTAQPGDMQGGTIFNLTRKQRVANVTINKVVR